MTRAPWRVRASSQAAPVDSARSSRRYTRIVRAGALAVAPLAFYLLLTLVVTFPLVRVFGVALPGDGRDGYQNYWNFWWTARALGAGQNPFVTPLLYSPDGAPLYLHTLNLFNGLLALPVGYFFGGAAAYNSVVIASFTLSGYFSYWLVRIVTGSFAAGLVGGVIYAFSAYHFARLLGHTNLLASEWFPAYVALLVVGTNARGKRRAAAVAGAAVSLVLLALCDWQYLLFAGMFSVLYASYHAITRRSVVPILVAGSGGLLGLLLLSPLLVATWRELPLIAESRLTLGGPAFYSADLLSFITPPPLQTWWGQPAERVGGLSIAPAVERSVYIGFVPLALALYAVRWRSRTVAFWVLTAFGFALLALGPVLQIAGRNTFGPDGREVWLPYRWLMAVPVVNISRVPARFALVATLCVAVLAGFGIVAAFQRRQWLTAPARRVALAASIGLALAEQWSVPYPVHALDPPRAYQQLGELGDGRAVLELPFDLARSRSLYYQTIHQHPLVGGYLSRPLPYPLLALPPFLRSESMRWRPEITAPPAPGTGAWALAMANVGWIAVLLEEQPADDTEIAGTLARYAEAVPRFADARVAVFATTPPGGPLFFAVPARGWHEREQLPASDAVMRWFEREAFIDAWSLSRSTQAGALCFQAWSYGMPRRLTLSIDGSVTGEWLVGAPARYRVPVSLTPGRHTVAFRSLDAPAWPSDAGQSTDTRLLAIGVSGVDLMRECT